MIVKGSRIQATWLQGNPKAALAGMQPKMAATARQITGTVRHLRGDDPVNPSIIKLYVEPEGDTDLPRTRPYGCECPGHDNLVEIDPNWITAIL